MQPWAGEKLKKKHFKMRQVFALILDGNRSKIAQT